MNKKVLIIICVIAGVLLLFILPVLLGGSKEFDSKQINSYRSKVKRIVGSVFQGTSVVIDDIDQRWDTNIKCSLNAKKQIEIEAQCNSIIRFKERKWRFGEITLTLVSGQPCTVTYTPTKRKSGGARPLPVEKELSLLGARSMKCSVLQEGGKIEITQCPGNGVFQFVIE